MSYQQTIYNMLRKAGMTEAGALGVLGNWEWESGCEPYRKENDNVSFRTVSKNYTEGIMNGSITKAQFATGKAGTGYGLAQWTYQPRQAELYDFWKAYGGRIDNVVMQVEFALKEFKRDFIDDWRLLCSTKSIDEAAKAVCDRFENPKIKNYGDRIRLAYKVKAELQLGEWEDTEVVIPAPVVEEYWPPRMLCRNMTGADVEVLQAILKARNYIQQNPDGVFGSFLEEKVKQFQTDYYLDADGVVGPLTWGELLSRGD